MNQTKTRAVTGVFTPQRCANVSCCNLQLFLLLCKRLQQQTFAQQQQTFAQQQKQSQVAGANVCKRLQTFAQQQKTVAGCRGKRLQTFANVAAPGTGGLRGPLGQAPRARGAPGLACATGARAAAAQVQLSLRGLTATHLHAPRTSRRGAVRAAVYGRV